MRVSVYIIMIESVAKDYEMITFLGICRLFIEGHFQAQALCYPIGLTWALLHS